MSPLQASDPLLIVSMQFEIQVQTRSPSLLHYKCDLQYSIPKTSIVFMHSIPAFQSCNAWNATLKSNVPASQCSIQRFLSMHAIQVCKHVLQASSPCLRSKPVILAGSASLLSELHSKPAVNSSSQNCSSRPTLLGGSPSPYSKPKL